MKTWITDRVDDPDMPLPTIARAENDIVIDSTDHRLIDLFSAKGTTFLGHCNPAMAKQLQQVWITGGLETSVHSDDSVPRAARATPISPSRPALNSHNSGNH